MRSPGVVASGIFNVPFDGYHQLLLSYLNETLSRDR